MKEIKFSKGFKRTIENKRKEEIAKKQVVKKKERPETFEVDFDFMDYNTRTEYPFGTFKCIIESDFEEWKEHLISGARNDGWTVIGENTLWDALEIGMIVDDI